MPILKKHYDSYYDYERDLGRGVVLPFLKNRGLLLNGKRVLDLGCGEGGVLAGLAEEFNFSGLGIDHDEDMINRSKPIQGIRFAVGDFYSFCFEEKYDLILIRDVLEHCGNPKALLGRAADLLSEEGWVYITYTPYLSPFGGHQHNGTGFFANVPYIQVLPEKLFLWLIRPDGNWYKGARNIMKDLKQIRRTRLTTSIVRRTCREVGLHIDYIRAYFVRPDYRYKFGLPAIALPSLFSAHTFTDIWSTCVEMMLHKGG